MNRPRNLMFRHFGWLIPPLAALMLAGCSGSSEIVKPAKLTEINNAHPPKILWTGSAGGSQKDELQRLAPMVDGDRVYVAGPKGEVYAYNLKTGDRLWSRDLDLSLNVGPGADDKMVVVGSASGKVIALAADSGKQLWQTQMTTSVDTPVSIGFGKVVVRTKDGSVSLLDAASGKQLWTVSHDEPALTLQGQSRSLMFRDAIAVGYDDGELAVLNNQDGTALWKVQVAQPTGRTDIDRMVDIDATPLFDNGIFYVATYQGRLAAISAHGGRVLWSRKFSGFDDMAADSHAIYATDADGTIWAFDRRTGEPLWRQPALAHRTVTGPVLDNGRLVVGDYEGYLSVLDPQTGQIIGRGELDGGVISPMRSNDGKVVATTRDGDVAVFTLP